MEVDNNKNDCEIEDEMQDLDDELRKFVNQSVKRFRKLF